MPHVVAEIPGTRLQQPKEKLRHPTLSKCLKRLRNRVLTGH